MMGVEALLASVLILGLFRLRNRFGLSLLLVTLGVFQPLQAILASSLYVPVWGDLAVSPGSVILFTASLFAVLLVYIREDALAARKVIYGLLAANLAMTLLMELVAVQMRLPGLLNFLNLPEAMFSQSVRVIVSGTLALFADGILIILVYEWLRPWLMRWPFARIYATMVLVLAFDNLAFATGAFWGQPLFRQVLLAGVAGKSVMALVYAVALVVYLRFIEPETAPSERPVRDIFYALTYRDKYERERQLAREALEASYARYHNLFHFAPVPLWEEDISDLMAYLEDLRRQGVRDWRAFFTEHPDELRRCVQKVRVVDVNQAAFDLHRARSKEELLERLENIFTERSFEALREEIVALAEGRRKFETTGEVRTLDGARRFVSLHVVILEGGKTALLATPDITAQVRQEARLRTLLALNEAVLAGKSPEEVARLALERLQEVLDFTVGSIVTYNFARQTGVVLATVGPHAPEMQTGAEVPLRMFGPEERLSLAHLEVTEDFCALEERSPGFETLLKHGVRSGIRVPLMLEGAVIGAINLGAPTPKAFTEEEARLVQELALAIALALQQARLRQERDLQLERFQRALETTLDGYILADTEGRIMDVNPAYCAMTGYAREELIGMNIRDIEAALTPEEIEARIARFVAQGRDRFRTRHRAKDGRVLDLDVSIALLPDSQGPLVAAFVRDITDQLRQEAELREREALARALAARLATAQEEERRHLARELHDEIGQNLTAVHLLLEMARNMLPADSPVAAQLDQAAHLVSETATRVRGVMTDLRPPMLDDHGLVPTLHWYAEEIARRSGLRVEVQAVAPEPRPGPEVELALFRIAQEALNNVVKHAQATEVRITLAADEAHLRLVVEDNGRGFVSPERPAPTGEHGWGLLSMRERAEMLGGTLKVESTPGRGTRVTVEVPR